MKPVMEVPASVALSDVKKLEDDGWLVVRNATASICNAVTTATHSAPEPFDEPESPPDEVMAAMKQISPVPDKTYEANWKYWERHKERARLHPEAFANEIIEGAVFDSPVSIVVMPDRLPIS